MYCIYACMRPPYNCIDDSKLLKQVMIPLGKIGAINPVLMRENPSEKYIQVITIDGHDFWFMGFVNFDKATKHLSESISTFLASGMAVKPVVA